MGMYIFEFGIKVTSGTMPVFFLLEKFFLLSLCILGHKKVIKQQ